jgi:excisionase family DNA binding protein
MSTARRPRLAVVAAPVGAEWAPMVAELERAAREAPLEALPELSGALARVSALVSLRLATEPLRDLQETLRAGARADRLLTVQEAAQRLGLTEDWLYRNHGRLPFARKVGEQTLRFSESGIDRWIRNGS